MKRILLTLISALFITTTAHAALFESKTNDAQPMVLYGKTSSGAIAPILVGSDGSVFGGSDGITFSGASGERLSGENSGNYIDFNDASISGTNLYTSIGGGLKIRDSNIWYLKENEDIDAFIASPEVFDGDILILASGTYSITADIDVTKSVAIVGQGVGVTIISNSTSAVNVFEIDANNVRIQDLSVVNTGSGTTRGIWLDCTATTVCSNTTIRNVSVTMSGGGIKRGINWAEGGGIIENVSVSVSSNDDDAEAFRFQHASTAEANITVYATNINATATTPGGTGDDAYGILQIETSATNDMTIYLSDFRVTATETGAGTSAGISVSGVDMFMYASNGIASGTDGDLLQADSGNFAVHNIISTNNTSSGTITYPGTRFGGALTGRTSTSPNTVKTGANTACNTTCAGSQCMFGIDDTNKIPLACTDTTSDTCVCLGP